MTPTHAIVPSENSIILLEILDHCSNRCGGGWHYWAITGDNNDGRGADAGVLMGDRQIAEDTFIRQSKTHAIEFTFGMESLHIMFLIYLTTCI